MITHDVRPLAVVLLSLLHPVVAIAEQVTEPKPLSAAHAHNDYAHPRPLLDALDHGFCSIEADIWLVGGKLLVGHSLLELRPERTLESLYLRPLAERCRQREGWVYDRGRTVTLLVDLKSTGGNTYPALQKELANYRQLFTQRDDKTPPAIEVIITGDRPVELIKADAQRLGSIDGRRQDLDSDQPASLIPLVSENWTSHFTWRGVGAMPNAERAKLRKFANMAHAKGRRLRFWATPDNEAVWTELQAAGVDLIGTDDLDKLQDFLTTPD